MRKIIYPMISILFLLFGLSGCINSGVEPPVIETPKPVLLDTVLYWQTVENAKKYAIYADNEIIAELSENTYDLDGLDDKAIRVAAIAQSGYSDSKKSYSLTKKAPVSTLVDIKTKEQLYEYCSQGTTKLLSSNKGYSIDFSQIDDYYSEVIIIPASVAQISYKGNPNIEQNITFFILARNDTLTLTLQDARIRAVDNRPAIEYESTAYNTKMPIVCVKSLGELNVITGGKNTVNGQNGANGTGMGRGDDGKNGGNGYAAIELPSILIAGSSPIEINGGNASNGGNGGDSSTNFITGYSNDGGDGGDGGNGGTAVKVQMLYINMSSGQSVKLSGGSGGRGGTAGNGLGNFAKNGNEGKSGTGLSGEKIVLSGMIK